MWRASHSPVLAASNKVSRLRGRLEQSTAFILFKKSCVSEVAHKLATPLLPVEYRGASSVSSLTQRPSEASRSALNCEAAATQIWTVTGALAS
ncbi:hypothetical protein WJX73_005120 [Symbiochloris irregularis]|uniref:Uncharacterized protein n=1 Tax=Symbiochloris irregularis TaxID=706552 RepID=A0AAW1NZR0_9CHLO